MLGRGAGMPEALPKFILISKGGILTRRVTALGVSVIKWVVPA